MNKRISLQDAVSKIKDGMTVMVGGFLSAGSPLDILEALSKTGVKNLTMISNDTAYQGIGNGNLIGNHQVSHLFVSHIGTNPDTAAQMNAGELKIEFCPQGTLAERVRCGGCGLGGVLTTTGLGTVMEYEQDGKTPKQKVTVDGMMGKNEKKFSATLQVDAAGRNISFSQFKQEKSEDLKNDAKQSEKQGVRQKVH